MSIETIIQKESPDIEAKKISLIEQAKELIEKPTTLPTLSFAPQGSLTKAGQQLVADQLGLSKEAGEQYTGFSQVPQALQTVGQGIGALGASQDLTNLALSGYAPIQAGALQGLGVASELGQAAAMGGMGGITDTLLGTQADKFLAQAQLAGTGGQFNPYGQPQLSPFPFPFAKQADVPGQMMEQTGSVVQGQPPTVGIPPMPPESPIPMPSPTPGPIPQPLPTTGGIGQFFNPFEDQVVQQALADVQRASDIAGQQDAAQAVSAGAFGGSRQAIMEAERARNLMDQQGQLAGQLRQAGFGQAMTQAQKAFEDAQARQLQKAQISGQLGAQYGQLGLAGQEAAAKLGLAGADLTGQMAQAAGNIGSQGAQLGLTGAGQLQNLGKTFGALGESQAGLGQLGQQMLYQDVDALTKLGAQQQEFEQAQKDQKYKEDLQKLYQPYQKLGFYSDIIQGAPTSQMTISQSTAPTPTIGSQLIGAGTAGLGLASAAQKSGII
tara:strand:- start:275 stop:1759 length:1485 start_codon:yes stop_codon:yes gene_type:complete